MNLDNMKMISLIMLLLYSSSCGAHQDNDESWIAREFGNEEAFTEPIEKIQVAAAETGIVAKVYVKLGDTVQPGDLLYELDMSVLEASRRVAKSKADNRAKLKSAEIEYQTKLARYEKLVKLAQEGAGSPEEVARSKADAEVASQEIEALREQANQFRLEVEQYEAQMEQRRVRSPIHGQVIEIKKKVGEHVSSNDLHLVSVVQIDTLRAVFHLPTLQATKLEKGNKVQIAFPESNLQTIGIVEYVSPITRADSGRVRVDILIGNREREFRSGVRCYLMKRVVYRDHDSLNKARR